MIDWLSIATRLGHKTEEEMWHALYDQQQLSIANLAARLGISRNAIRLALAHRGVRIRGRGGPNRQSTELTPELIEEIKRKGVLATAKRMGLNYTTLYKRLRRLGISVADLRVAEGEKSSESNVPVPVEDEPGEDVHDDPPR